MNWNLSNIVLQITSTVLSQVNAEAEEQIVDKPSLIDINIIRHGGFGLSVVVAFFLIFYVVYPATLKRAIRIMPRSLYGVCLAFWLVLIEGLFIGVYWKYFVIGDELQAINTIWPKVAWLVVMLISFFGSISYFRSPRAAKAEVATKGPVVAK